ncbi:MAG: AAA family ATPase, partial [Fimbriimonadales bacterium]
MQANWQAFAQQTEISKAWFERLETQLTILRAEQKAGFEQIGGRFDEVMESLVELKEDLTHLLPRMMRRLSLHRHYTGAEVADRVEQLLKDYTKLFVGREEETAQIDAFLSAAPSGKMVITAKAGYGKTALLANWVTNRRGEGYFIAYHFFSQRYDATRPSINFYSHLLRQLYLYHELEDEPMPNDEQSLRGALFQMVQERGARPDEPLVIVIDALDEAERVFSPPFPAQLPDGVFLIVSARADEDEMPDYLREWTENAETLHLHRLPVDAIRRYLQSADDGVLATFAEDDHFLVQVEQKTEGFPLYLRFLTEEMIQNAQAGKDVRTTLSRSPRGFSEYVREQFKQLAKSEEVQRNKEVQKLFALLSVAVGALSNEDIQELTGLTPFELEALPWVATRWFTLQRLEDGTTLYAFAHPLLGDEFEGVLGSLARDAQSELINYCARWQEHRSPYALRHYHEHLHEAKRYDELYALACNPAFLQAQRERLPNEPDLPLITLQSALIASAEMDNAERMADLLLRHAYQLQQILQESPLQALRAGKSIEAVWTLADQYDNERCVLWYLLLAWELKEASRVDEARATLERLLNKNLPRLSGWQGECASYLLHLHALEIGVDAFISLARQLLEPGDLSDLCVCLIEQELFNLALRTAQVIVDDRRRVLALVAIAQAQAKAVAMDAACATFELALQAAQQIEENGLGKSALTRIVEAQAQVKQFELALQTAKVIKNKEERVKALMAIAQAQAEAGKNESARDTLHRAQQTTQEIKDEKKRVEALTAIAQTQAKAEEVESARATFELALQAAQQ